MIRLVKIRIFDFQKKLYHNLNFYCKILLVLNQLNFENNSYIKNLLNKKSKVILRKLISF